MSTLLHTLIGLTDVVPRVDDPWPSHIGLGFPFTLAGAGSAVGSFAYPRGSSAQRDRASRLFSLVGFAFGALGYVIALTVQLMFPSR